ncbi:MAG: hypothetical protein KGJ60_05935 [Verrucomicrobiota bacterium]|nr:hypothetical protein [Verrucomicrobiota bacterium]
MTASERSREFLKISGQFKLGALVTEASHPLTARLSDVASSDAAAALNLLFEVDGDVLRKFREFVESGRAGEISGSVLRSLKNGGRIFFTGCGSTGRLSILLDSVWRDFWRGVEEFENRAFSVMAGGDFALIKSVEGFEDFAVFGKKQMTDLGVSNRDVVFAVTEGGETSFVIGTAWAGVEAGAKVYFVYNNPDDLLCRTVERSREVIQDPRIEKVNLTTGPMAVSGSTRLQATSIQLCVLLCVLEMAVQELVLERADMAALSNAATCRRSPKDVPAQFLAALEELHANLKSPGVRGSLAQLIALEASVYRGGGRNNYFTDHFGIDVLTDTTERSPTFCTPPFRKFDDAAAAESWAFLFVPQPETPAAWRRILKREPRCIAWSEAELRELTGVDNFSRTLETIRNIGRGELMRFKIGVDGLAQRASKPGDCAVGILSGRVEDALLSSNGFLRAQLDAARAAGARTGLIRFGGDQTEETASKNVMDRNAQSELIRVGIPVPRADFLLDGVTRVAVKLVMNALSTCVMAWLGRVMGNTMVWVVPSNLKLIDRATRYVARLTGLPYERANRLLFEVIEYVEPRMKSDRAYPPVVAMAVTRARRNCSNEAAETFLQRS